MLYKTEEMCDKAVNRCFWYLILHIFCISNQVAKAQGLSCDKN